MVNIGCLGRLGPNAGRKSLPHHAGSSTIIWAELMVRSWIGKKTSHPHLKQEYTGTIGLTDHNQACSDQASPCLMSISDSDNNSK